MLGWMTALFWVTVKAKYLFGQPLGNPVPVIVNLPPAVEMLVGELAVIAALITKRYALVSPVGSTRTLTLYCPASTLGTAKVREVLDTVEGVTSVTRLVLRLVRTTMGDPRLKLVPLRTILPEVMVLALILVNVGD